VHAQTESVRQYSSLAGAIPNLRWYRQKSSLPANKPEEIRVPVVTLDSYLFERYLDQDVEIGDKAEYGIVLLER
jgi:hypothetical protein